MEKNPGTCWPLAGASALTKSNSRLILLIRMSSNFYKKLMVSRRMVVSCMAKESKISAQCCKHDHCRMLFIHIGLTLIEHSYENHP